MPSAAKQRLSEVAGEVDPLRLLDEIRTEQHRLVALAAGQLVHLSASANELNTFLQSLATAWSDGEVRPTHQANPKPPRNWRTRKDPFEVVWPLVQEWLEVAPETTATQLLARLQAEHSDRFPDAQLRTLQRKVKRWRSAKARSLIFTPDNVSLDHQPSSPPSHRSVRLLKRGSGNMN